MIHRLPEEKTRPPAIAGGLVFLYTENHRLGLWFQEA